MPLTFARLVSEAKSATHRVRARSFTCAQYARCRAPPLSSAAAVERRRCRAPPLSSAAAAAPPPLPPSTCSPLAAAHLRSLDRAAATQSARSHARRLLEFVDFRQQACARERSARSHSSPQPTPPSPYNRRVMEEARLHRASRFTDAAAHN